MAPVKAAFSSPFQARESPRQARDTPRTRRNDDSPSRKTEYDLEQAFRQIHIHHSEWQKVHAFQRKQQQEDLDAKESARAKVHCESLDSATAQHNLVRQQAEAVLHAYLEREEEERRRREEERQRKEEEERRRKEEDDRQRRAQEERRRHEAELARRKAEEERLAREAKERRENEERERQERERQADEQRKAEEEAETKARQQREATKQAEEAQRQAQVKADQENAAKAAQAAQAAKASAAPRVASNFESEHRAYLIIHKRLKAFRKELWTASRADPQLKPHIGDMRRAIRTVVGQLTGDKDTDKVAQEKVANLLRRAQTNIPSAPVSVNEYLPPWQSLNDGNETKIPSLLLYLLSIFSKAVVSAYANECSTNIKAAEPIGVMVAKVFSLPNLQFNRNASSDNNQSATISLISVLVSKFHASAPILFGIYGPESTQEGKLRLGWRLTDTDVGGTKAFVTPNTHWDRLKGLGAGYASITLRNFSRAKNTQHPWPPTHYWTSIAHILNTPPSEVTISHLTVLKSMMENNAVDRFVLFFGAAAVAVLKQATILFPRTLPKVLQDGQEGRTLTYLLETWKEKNHFTLE